MISAFLQMIQNHDKLTPNGQVPEHGNLFKSGLNLLKSFEGH
jgi:uncharacterized protein YidB (DUF937 family)